ncbi:poly(U)-specific endoribonuclease homolog isoform X2 [Leptopilina heterotoma]|uniref:poly(U)-specific endoribonuclease homolog isoform X2 n=1 Tax=Leptopilina heterotoma TaxID=63436 RepID=UPI001CA7E918|nr:poly(U)-specific endoribonuclease homolog isoform X2 [Leptopilina heterotoma]
MKSLYFLVFVIAVSFVIDVDAGWKFWKKDKDKDGTTETPLITSSASPVTQRPTSRGAATPVAAQVTTAKTPVNVNAALAGVANPGLSIGAGNTAENIRDNARPQRPNPGTEVGLDIPRQKPGNSGYRDWAIDLTGAGEGRTPPRVPGQGPATLGGQLPPPGPVQTPRPASPVQTSNPEISGPTPRPGSPVPQRNSAGPAGLGYPTENSRPGSPASTGGSKDFPSLPNAAGGPVNAGGSPSRSQSPTGGKTFAQIASSGSTTTTTSRPNFGVPVYGGAKPGNIPPTSQPGRTRVATGLVGAAAAGAAGAAASRFSSNPTFSKGNTVTDEDLEKLSEALFIKDANNAMKYITLNLQKQTTGSSPVDEAPQPLLNVKPEALQIPTIQKVLTIYDNYQLDTRTNEHINPSQRQEESLLVDTFLSTNVMSFAMRFLSNKGFLKQDYYAYKDLLRTMWFNLYSRGDGKIGSTGFEHVFMTELKLGTEVSGLHNWIYFNAEELKKRADYLGYLKKIDLGDKAAVLKVHSKFNNIDKPVTTMFIGTSPELEMSLYTVCFLVRPDGSCPVSLGGTKFNIITHKFRYRGKDHVGSAYPDI